MPRGQPALDRAQAAQARRSVRPAPGSRGLEARPLSPATPPMRSTSVDSEPTCSPTERQRVVMWGRSIARHWASGRVGRAPRGTLLGARLREPIDDVDPSIGADTGLVSDVGANNSAVSLVEPPSQASGANGPLDSAIRQASGASGPLEAATTQLAKNAEEVGASSGGPKRKEHQVALKSSSCPASEQAGGQLPVAAADSDSDSVIIVECSRRRRHRARASA